MRKGLLLICFGVVVFLCSCHKNKSIEGIWLYSTLHLESGNYHSLMIAITEDTIEFMKVGDEYADKDFISEKFAYFIQNNLFILNLGSNNFDTAKIVQCNNGLMTIDFM